jgi:predicted DsbA family dithiol-disulfide isomerase
MNDLALEVFTDYVCPWCYLGDARVKKIKNNFDINKISSFPIAP